MVFCKVKSGLTNLLVLKKANRGKAVGW